MASTAPHSASVANDICTTLTLLILLVRILSNWVHKELSKASTYLVLTAISVVIARAVVDVYYLRYGTVSELDTALASDPTLAISDITLAHAITGTKLSLCARLLVTTFYWLQCSILLLTYRALVNHIRWAHHVIWLCWALIAITYIAVTLVTLLECHPLALNWQLTPTPDLCVRAYAQLLTQCLSNIAIDVVLVVIAVPIIRIHKGTMMKNLQIGLLFTLGILCVIITCIRCWQTFEVASYQTTRSLWASIQATVAAFVANISSIYGAGRICRRRYQRGNKHSRIPNALHDSHLGNFPAKAQLWNYPFSSSARNETKDEMDVRHIEDATIELG